MKKRDFTSEDVRRLSGSVQIDHTLARMGAKRVRHSFEENEYINTYGA